MSHDDVVHVYLEETFERLDSIESDLMTLEESDTCEPNLIDSIFRNAHSIKAGANLLKLRTIEELAHKLENVLEMIRQHKLNTNKIVVTASLEAVDKLRELLENIDKSENISIRLHTAMLEIAVKNALEAMENK